MATAFPVKADRDDGRDHDRALEALRSGEVLSLRAILDRVQTEFGGDLIEAELEDEDHRLVYEIKLLTAEGRVLKLEYDARTGDLLKTKEKPSR